MSIHTKRSICVSVFLTVIFLYRITEYQPLRYLGFGLAVPTLILLYLSWNALKKRSN